MKYEGKVPNLTLNIKITNNTTADNICTQGNDASFSLSQLFDESENKVPLRGTSKKAIFVVIMYLTSAEKCLMKPKLTFWKKDWALYLHLLQLIREILEEILVNLVEK